MPNYGHELESSVEEIGKRITNGMRSRCYRAANELRNASQLVLRGQRSGRRYRVPGTKQYYTASAPGEPPAVRTGTFRASWQPITMAGGMVGQSGFNVTARIRNTSRTDNGRYYLAEILEEGTGKMAPRLHHEKIQQKALPKIERIYSEPY